MTTNDSCKVRKRQVLGDNVAFYVKNDDYQHINYPYRAIMFAILQGACLMVLRNINENYYMPALENARERLLQAEYQSNLE